MYTAAGQPDREQLVQRFVPLVKRIAYHLMARLPPSVQFDDLVQNGMIGLLDAIDRYQEGFGAQFETYATQRVRGAMLDGLRENDWLPRNLRRELRRIETAINQLEHEHGRAPSERELAEALGMTLADYQKTLQDARGHQLVYIEDFSGEGDEDFLERHFTDNDADPASHPGGAGRQAAAGLGHWPLARAREADDGASITNRTSTCAKSARSWG
jgi:RNA polymerase sigma factor for flagellar operon FliA